MSHFTDLAAAHFGTSVITRSELNDFLKDHGRSWDKDIMDYKVGHGKFQFIKIDEVVNQLTDSEILHNIRSRFATLELMTNATTSGLNRSMIVSGPAGLGKTYTVMDAMKRVPENNQTQIKGYVTSLSLYKTLYEYRDSNKVVIFDDCDSIFSDETALNLLKAACDSSDKRTICWMSDYEIKTDTGEEVPNSFVFDGSIIFITNIDFDKAIEKGTRASCHFEALISRSHYVDLGIKTTRDYIIRIKQVVADTNMLSHIDDETSSEVIEFIVDNKDRMRELSLRMVKKVADLTMIGDNWKELAACTCMKG